MSKSIEESISLVAKDGSEVDPHETFAEWEQLIMDNLDELMKFETDLKYVAEDGRIVVSGKDGAGQEVEPVVFTASDYPAVYRSLNEQVMMHLGR